MGFLNKGRASYKLGSKIIDEANIGDSKFVKYNAITGNLEYADINISSISNFKGWAYQDFTAGSITGTTVTLTSNENGIGIVFDPTKIINNTAVIVLKNNTEQKPYTGAIKLFSNMVNIVNHNGINIDLNGIPHTSWGDVRIYYYYNYASIPTDYSIAPKSVSGTLFNELDSLFVTEEEFLNSTIDGGSF